MLGSSPRATRRPRALLSAGALAAAAFVAVPAGTASAASCYSFAKTDTADFVWDFHYNADGSLDNGTWDAYDGFGSLHVSGNYYYPDQDEACSFEDGRDEYVFPADATLGTLPAEVTATRKVYVPSTGTAFARWLDIVENSGETAQTVDVTFRGNLGSDAATLVVASADGDQSADAGDPWVSTDDQLDKGPSDPDNPDDPALAHVADGSRTDGRRDSNDGWGTLANGVDNVAVNYSGITIPAGGRVILMHLEAQRDTRAQATEAAETLSAGPAEIFAGMSAEEGADVINWSANDFDGDGVANAADNCMQTANADQSDVDGDGVGDACDEDIDGDGLSNDVEAAIGTDPTRADTDGDGVGDQGDRCPTTAGDRADGCRAEDAPPTVAIISPADGVKIDPGEPTTITATASDDKGVARVVFVDDGKVIGEDATAPYSIGYQPKGEDVGRNTLAAIAVDGAGQTGTAFLQVESDRFSADSLSARTTPKRDRSLPFRFTTRGRLDLPEGVTQAEACAGKVSVQIKAGKKTVSNRRRKVRSDCTYRSRVTFTLPRRLNPSKLKVVTRFRGNAVLKPERAKVQKVRVG